MATKTRGWYVVTRLSNGRTDVHGGPYATKKAATQAIFAGLKIRNYSGSEIVQWSGAEIERRRSILNMPESGATDE